MKISNLKNKINSNNFCNIIEKLNNVQNYSEDLKQLENNVNYTIEKINGI